jgi:hypothetical protein
VYSSVFLALPSEVFTAVQDIARSSPTQQSLTCKLSKEALLSCFTSSPLQQCFKLLDLPSLGDHPTSALFVEMQTLLSPDANISFHATFLRHLLENGINSLFSPVYDLRYFKNINYHLSERQFLSFFLNKGQSQEKKPHKTYTMSFLK